VGRADPHPIELIGREAESRALAERIDAASVPQGGALLVRGEPGIGKSSLLESAKAHATAKRLRILTTTGVQSESRLPFAGLHQLLHALLDQVEGLPESYGNAIRAAFGLSEQTAPTPYLIAMAVLRLLGECAESAPILLLVDDAHWLDPSSAEALAFVARRLESDPIVMIAALRDGYESPLLAARIPELPLVGLSDLDAAALLAARAPALAAKQRDRILEEAAGNPLALVELPIALAAEQDDAPRTRSLAITDRLEMAFAERLSSLTPATRRLLHVAAVDASGNLAEILSAASNLERREATLESVSEAEAARLIETDATHLRFRHPLIRSAIHHAMSLDQRQAAHAALAATLEGDPDRCVWHRAAAAFGRSEEIAAELEAAAKRAHDRGAISVGFDAIERAAQLSADPGRRPSRLIRAVLVASVLGRRDDVLRLLNELANINLGPLDGPQVAFLRESIQGTYRGSSWVTPLADVADRMRADGDTDRGLDTLNEMGLRCWWSNPDAGIRAHVVEVAERFPVREDDVRLLHILALAAPIERGALVLERIARRKPETVDPLGGAQKIGHAAVATGDFVRAERFIDVAVSSQRARGLLGALPGMLTHQAWVKTQLGDWKQASSLASEAARLADETGQQTWAAYANLAAATMLAYRGEVDQAEALATESETALLRRGPNPMLALVQYARGAAALAGNRHVEAFENLRRIFDREDSSHHPHVRGWALVDFVEAAVHSGHDGEAAAVVSELEAIASQSRSPLLEAALKFARPVLSPEGNEAAFQAAAGLGLADWPFTRARLQLAYGVWLRRQRRAADSRTPLRAARDGFDALGATPWGERARQELRASGETSRRRTYDLSDALSPQELQIAQLAATGLGNREIGQQLFLSHRTIGSHLYRIFPKLGITTRNQLSVALQSRSSEQPPRHFQSND
jgi:DNA-binding CsgD family transcriptional regulator